MQTQGVFYSNTLDFNGKAATINAGGASGGTLTNFDILTLTGAGDFIGIANGGTLIIVRRCRRQLGEHVDARHVDDG